MNVTCLSLSVGEPVVVLMSISSLKPAENLKICVIRNLRLENVVLDPNNMFFFKIYSCNMSRFTVPKNNTQPIGHNLSRPCSKYPRESPFYRSNVSLLRFSSGRQIAMLDYK